ncbi:hypothetical protein NMY22_g14176 [Coprinellus aureogranulatus]|nr:hypothetical protein NMY22_g14176 [Coprinellus aureogranulatus]
MKEADGSGSAGGGVARREVKEWARFDGWTALWKGKRQAPEEEEDRQTPEEEGDSPVPEEEEDGQVDKKQVGRDAVKVQVGSEEEEVSDDAADSRKQAAKEDSDANAGSDYDAMPEDDASHTDPPPPVEDVSQKVSRPNSVYRPARILVNPRCPTTYAGVSHTKLARDLFGEGEDDESEGEGRYILEDWEGAPEYFICQEQRQTGGRKATKTQRRLGFSIHDELEALKELGQKVAIGPVGGRGFEEGGYAAECQAYPVSVERSFRRSLDIHGTVIVLDTMLVELVARTSAPPPVESGPSELEAAVALATHSFFGSPSSLPATTPPPIHPPLFEGLEGDLPDIAGLSIWFEDDDSADAPSLPHQSQAVLDYAHHDDASDSSDVSQDASFLTSTTDTADMSSDNSFGPFTPSTSNTRIAVREGAARARRALSRGVGLGILGVDLEPSFQSTFADPGASSKGSKAIVPDPAIVVSDGGGPKSYQGLDSHTTNFLFNFVEQQPFSYGQALTSIPECDSWKELSEAFLSSRPLPRDTGSADTSFTYSDSSGSSGRESEGDRSYDLDLSFSFPPQAAFSGSDAEHSTPARKSRTKTFSSPTISSDLKRASSLGPKPCSPGLFHDAERSPTIPISFDAPSSETPLPFSGGGQFRSSASAHLSSRGDAVELSEGFIVEVQQVVTLLPHSPIGHARSAHRRWRM